MAKKGTNQTTLVSGAAGRTIRLRDNTLIQAFHRKLGATQHRKHVPLASFLQVKPQEDQPRQRPSAPVAFSLPTNALSKRAEQPKRQDDETLVETPAARPSPEERRHLKWGPPQQRQSARTTKSSCKRRRPALPQKKTL